MPRAEFEFLIGEEWGEVLKRHAFLRQFGTKTVDADHFVHREKFLRLRVQTDGALYRVTRFETVLAHLVFADIDIVRRGEVVVVRRTQKTVSVRRAFQRTHCNHVFSQIRHCRLLRLLRFLRFLYFLYFLRLLSLILLPFREGWGRLLFLFYLFLLLWSSAFLLGGLSRFGRLTAYF